MSQHKDLQKAIRQMADGSKSGFHTFYLGSSQFVYSSALLLYGEHAAACSFMVDFYQYLYLHLPEYSQSQDLEKWISRLIMERFGQLSIGKNIRRPTVKDQMGAGTAPLEKTEQERVWRLLEERMHFPKEAPKKRGGSRTLLIFTVLLLVLLLVYHFRQPILEGLRNAMTQEADEGDKGEKDADGENDGHTLPEDPEENLNAGAVLPEDPTAVNLNDNGTDAGDAQISDGEKPAVDEPAADTPNVPSVNTPAVDPPTTAPPSVDTPTVPEPTVNSPIPDQEGSFDGSVESSDYSDLENLELELYYGDSLTD